MRLRIKSQKIEPKPLHPRVLITGDGRTLAEDLMAFDGQCDVMAIGRSYQIITGPIRHWANVDGNECKWWCENLPLVNDGNPPIRHSLGEPYPWFDVEWEVVDNPFWDAEEVLWHGSSALFAVHCCLALGYESITLAGCPLDSNGHWYDPTPGPRWTGESFQAWLEFARTDEARKVKSLSGYTKQILG